MPKVFISYSRENSDFMRHLYTALAESGFDSWVDWENIHKGADWLEAIYRGIEASDNFVLIVTNASLTSEICHLEIAHALAQGKRILPVVHQDPDEKIFAPVWFEQAWEEQARSHWKILRHLNWQFFRPTDDFKKSLAQLIGAIETDVVYVQNHTRLSEHARDWERNNHGSEYLLSGTELTQAEAWLANSSNKKPEPLPLHTTFIRASRQTEDYKIAETKRINQQVQRLRQARIGFGLVAGVMLLLALGAIVLANSARQAQIKAEDLRGTAQYDASLARQAEADAESLRVEVEQQATLFSAQQNRYLTELPGVGIVPTHAVTLESTQFFATETQISQLALWQPVIQSFDGVDMVLVPAGCFVMGSMIVSDEQPTSEICFEENFWIDRYEVTNTQFMQFDGEAEHPPTWDAPELPRESITWLEALAFCEEKRGIRLPTEAEWEYAARGPFSFTYPWGNQFDSNQAIYFANSDDQTDEVQAKAGLSWVGANGMSGNVWEWVSSMYRDYPYDSLDGRESMEATNNRRSARGGSWDNDSFNLRSANRHWGNPKLSASYFGFRCARDAD